MRRRRWAIIGVLAQCARLLRVGRSVGAVETLGCGRRSEVLSRVSSGPSSSRCRRGKEAVRESARIDGGARSDEPRVYSASAGRTTVSVDGGGESLSLVRRPISSCVRTSAAAHCCAVLAGPIYEQSSVGDGRPGKFPSARRPSFR